MKCENANLNWFFFQCTFLKHMAWREGLKKFHVIFAFLFGKSL